MVGCVKEGADGQLLAAQLAVAQHRGQGRGASRAQPDHSELPLVRLDSAPRLPLCLLGFTRPAPRGF